MKKPLRVLYAATIGLSAFLLFLIQPIFAKLILPWFGGTAAVWTTCLVFFQAALLAGYFYASRLSQFDARRQAIVHTVLLACAVALLPVMPSARWSVDPAANPIWKIFALLAAVLGLPYFLLAATSPLLQSWFARRAHPYRLFALSNAGALLALIAYPILIEPRIPTRLQDLLWSGGFAAFAALCAISAWVHASDSAPAIETKPAPRRDLMTWAALAAGGSMLLLATTNQLTQNVAPAPFLWILPLAVYLATFILCFDHPRWYHRGLYLRLLAIALVSAACAIYDVQLTDALIVEIPLFAFALFAGCMFCHGELVARKPEAPQLTSFYLMIALGGALGALFVGLIAPAVFSAIYEMPIALLFIASLVLWLNWGEGWSARLLWSVAAVAMVVVTYIQYGAYHYHAILLTRNFYGALRVVEDSGIRTLYHGTVKHGSQFLSRERRAWPTTYYGPSSGIGRAMQAWSTAPKNVGVIGLGAGTLSAYAQPGDEFRFYEINPSVAQIARTQFTFLRDAPATTSVALGDARLTLEHEPSHNFDILAVDAFSGDAIPVHLLTEEAFAVYMRHLKPTGVLAIHVSNQFLDLPPVVERLASLYRWSAVQIHSDRDPSRDVAEATWVLLTSRRDVLDRPGIAGVARPIAPRPQLRPWTDDYNNLFEVIRWIPQR